MTGIIFTITTSGSIAYILTKLFSFLFSRKLSIQVNAARFVGKFLTLNYQRLIKSSKYRKGEI